MRILVTAGPTREPLDAVRFISNYSTGRMGYEIARKARARGHEVILISGPATLTPPRGVRMIFVETALEMQAAVRKHFPGARALIMSAAVSDYRPRKRHRGKIKKGGKKIKLDLEENPDILREIGKRKGNKIVVGFALETEGLIANARHKLKQKGLDFIVGNKIVVSKKASSLARPFGDKGIEAVIIDKDGCVEEIQSSSKKTLANILLRKIEKLIK